MRGNVRTTSVKEISSPRKKVPGNKKTSCCVQVEHKSTARAEYHKHRNTLTPIPTSSLASDLLIQYNFNETTGLKNIVSPRTKYAT